MRLWTVHPKYLDAKGLVALWREGLLAQKVLRGLTRGYRHHPQLDRFRAQRRPVAAVASYLRSVHAEATRRGYVFDGSKIARTPRTEPIRETRAQLLYEWSHLRQKLRRRDREQLAVCEKIARPRPHPLFRIVRGTWHEGLGRRRAPKPALKPRARHPRR